jgi:glycosyltransferase involved in cell wall biosynthesis
MKHLRCVHIGNLALPEKNHVYSLKSYAKLYNELVHCEHETEVALFAGYILPGETGFDFLHEERLSNRICFTLSKGNTPTTGLLPFLWNNLILFCRLTLYSLRKGDYFIFLPSPIGVWSVLVTTLFQRKTTLGVYIGGYYQKEQASEQRNGFIKKKIKKTSAGMVEKLVAYSIRKSDYVITPSYELFDLYRPTQKIFLTPPMINVDEQDLKVSFPKHNGKYITYCGELRHAKGVVDLLKAFVRLTKEKRITGYKLKIIGSGQAFNELNLLVRENNVEDLVLFCGQIKDKAELKKALGTSDIFVLPSYSEGFPRVAYECFTLGVPTVLTPVGGIPFLVKDEIHCLLAQPGDINDLAAKIESLVSDRDLQLRLARNAKQLMIDSVFPRIKADVSLARVLKEKRKQYSG